MIAVSTVLISSGWQLKPVNHPPQIEQGVLDLSDYDFSRGTISLDGDWAFYWRQLPSSQDLPLSRPDLFAHVPSTWDSYRVDGVKLPGRGFGTYVLQVKTNLPAGSLLGLNLNRFSSAYKLYIDGQSVAQNGQLATSEAAETGQYQPQMTIFAIPGNSFDIVLQVSNFQLAKGGFRFSAYLGRSAETINHYNNMLLQQYFLLGALLISGFLFLSIFLFLKEQKSALYFAGLCLIAAIFEDTKSQFLLTRLMPDLAFSQVIQIMCIATFLIVFFYLYYLRELFPSRFARILTRIYAVLTAGLIVFYLLTPPILFSQIFSVVNYIELVFGMMSFFIIAKGLKNRVPGAGLNVVAQMIIVGAFTIDTFFMTDVIKTYSSGIRVTASLLFLFLQMVVQARRIILYHQTATAAELNMLQSQINPHFLYNTLSTIIFMSRTDWDKARTQLQNFSDYLRSSFNFKSLSQFSPLSKELELTQIYLNIEKARFEERLTFEIVNNASPELTVPVLTIQPLVENAVTHGILSKPEGVHVVIRIDQGKSYATVSVQDNGVGIPSEKLMKLRSQFKEHTGIGLVNIDTRLNKLYGRGLQIDSELGVGTTVSFRIPTRKRHNRNRVD